MLTEVRRWLTLASSVLVPAGRLSNLPLELQIKIIHDAANSLDFLKDDRERRLMLVAFSLVSRAWLVSQRFLTTAPFLPAGLD